MTPAVKVGAAILPVVTTSLIPSPEQVVMVASIVSGLLLGAMWRAGSLRGEGQEWGPVRHDLMISALIGGANSVLAIALAEWLQLGVMSSMAVGVVIGATGLRALPEIRDAFIGMAKRKLLENDNVVLIEPKEHTVVSPTKADPELLRLTRQFDEPPTDPKVDDEP